MKYSKEKTYELIDKSLLDSKTQMIQYLDQLRDNTDYYTCESLCIKIEETYNYMLRCLNKLQLKFGIYAEEYKEEFEWSMGVHMVQMKLLLADMKFVHSIRGLVNQEI